MFLKLNYSLLSWVNIASVTQTTTFETLLKFLKMTEARLMSYDIQPYDNLSIKHRYTHKCYSQALNMFVFMCDELLTDVHYVRLRANKSYTLWAFVNFNDNGITRVLHITRYLRLVL